MSHPNHDEGEFTTASDDIKDTAHSPEGISLSYEELFNDDTGEDRPCYLPDKGISTSELNNTSEEVDFAVDNGATGATISEKQTDGSEAAMAGYSVSSEDAKQREISGEKVGAQTNSDSNDDTSGTDLQEDEQEVELYHKGVIVHIHSTEIASGGEREVSESELLMEEQFENGHVKSYQEEKSYDLLTPDSSGYVAESSSATSLCSQNGVEEHESLIQEGGESGMDAPIQNLIPARLRHDEDDTSTSWRQHKKHFFILSHAGKPIYSRYGDEYKLAGFAATLQAIIAFVENSGDCIRYIRAGDHQIVFLVKGPIYLVSISATDEPVQALRGQLELMHGQLLLILTKSLEKCFSKNAKFDMKPLLGGTEVVFSTLIQSFSWNYASFLHSYMCLPLPHTARQAAGAALQDVADSDILFALLLSDSKVISLIGTQKASLHPDDILLLSNFVSSFESFRTTESYSPVCLPKYNAMAFLYAYVRYLDTDTYLILITTNPDAFFHLKECRARAESFLMETHVLRDIASSVLKGGLRVEDLPGDTVYGSFPRSSRLGNNTDNKTSEPAAATTRQRIGVGGAAGLWHFIYRSVYLDQYVASEFSAPLHTRQVQKRLFRAYERLYASMHGGPAGSHQMQYRRDEHFVLLAWSTADFEFFAAFDPLAEKSSAITVCNRVCQWIRDVESDVFYLGASPFNW